MSDAAVRGMLTERVQEAARKHLGREITVQELRLIPFIQYLMVNEASLGRDKVNQEELRILASWSQDGWVSYGLGHKVTVTESFWNAISEIIWVGYVNYDGQALPEHGSVTSE